MSGGGGWSYGRSCVEGARKYDQLGLWGLGIGSGLSRVNDYAAENDRGRLALVASLPKNTYSAEKHLQ